MPLLDHTLVEWVARIPSRLKLRGSQGKYLLKAALEPYVSREILYRPKQGFVVPLAAWFRGPLRRRLRETLCGPVLGDSGLFDITKIETLIGQHQSGARDHSAPLWMLSMMEAFLRQVDGAAETRRPLKIAETAA